MAKKGAKRKPALGAIVAIPLPGKKFAFAKIFRNRDFGVYDLVSNKVEPVEKVIKQKIAFFQPATHSAIEAGKWQIIGEEPFPDEDSAWSPPKAAGMFSAEDIDPNELQVSHKGIRKRATLKDVAGFDIEVFYDEPEELIEVIVDRLIKGQHKKYQVPRR